MILTSSGLMYVTWGKSRHGEGASIGPAWEECFDEILVQQCRRGELGGDEILSSVPVVIFLSF